MTWRNEQFLEVLRCPVLVVGVGGIGCELLKNLALTGFSSIEIVNFYISVMLWQYTVQAFLYSEMIW